MHAMSIEFFCKKFATSKILFSRPFALKFKSHSGFKIFCLGRAQTNLAKLLLAKALLLKHAFFC